MPPPELLPDEPEVLGLAATVLLARAREGARVGADGAMIPLSEQDTQLWDTARIARAQELSERALAIGKAGPYQALAAIHLAYSMRLYSGETPWRVIAKLGEGLMALRPSPVAAINQAVALGRATTPQEGLIALEALDKDQLEEFLPYQVAKADLSDRSGDSEAASAAFEQALTLDPGPAERLYLEKRLARLR